jgi:hypothetical protein
MVDALVISERTICDSITGVFRDDSRFRHVIRGGETVREVASTWDVIIGSTPKRIARVLGADRLVQNAAHSGTGSRRIGAEFSRRFRHRLPTQPRKRLSACAHWLERSLRT